MNINAVVKGGKYQGTLLRPHRYDDDTYVVSRTRFEKDSLRVASLEEVAQKVALGHAVRMSNPEKGVVAPSLISASSITIFP